MTKYRHLIINGSDTVLNISNGYEDNTQERQVTVANSPKYAIN